MKKMRKKMGKKKKEKKTACKVCLRPLVGKANKKKKMTNHLRGREGQVARVDTLVLTPLSARSCLSSSCHFFLTRSVNPTLTSIPTLHLT